MSDTIRIELVLTLSTASEDIVSLYLEPPSAKADRSMNALTPHHVFIFFGPRQLATREYCNVKIQ